MSQNKGYVGLTDPQWYSFLSDHPKVDEVNFWQPRGNRTFRAIREGDPFFFKLRAPLKAIVGFGFFHHFEVMPAWLAWECFGAMNGAPDFESMLDRILRLRRDSDRDPRSGEFEIGCVMIAAPVFLEREQWVTPPSDWARTGIQQGKTYALDEGEGQRILGECLARARTGTHYWNVEPVHSLVAEGSERYGPPVPVRPRLGQGLFSLAVRDAYTGACAVTREHSAPVLEAAHIKPYAQGGEHRVDNGLYLRSDLHRLYDRGYVTVTPDFEFIVGKRLREEYGNGRSYEALDRWPILLPNRESWMPNRELLDWHHQEVFRG